MIGLDARQRAMLEEMGVRVWAPMVDPVREPAAVPDAIVVQADEAPVTAPATARAARAPAIRAEESAPARSTEARPATPARSPAAASQAPNLADVWLDAEAQRLYANEAAPQGGWLIVADMPPAADGRHGAALAGDAGKLLDNMLRALQLERAPVAVHLLRVHRGAAVPAGAGGSGSARLADGIAPQLDRLAPRVVLALGALAAQHLFDSSEPLGRLRGRAGTIVGRPGIALVASYPPGYLLRNQADKARAWLDLCLAASLAS